MLRSAKRLTGDVQTDRFPWQSPQLTQIDAIHADALVRSIDTPSGTPHFAALHDLSLPSAAEERAQAAERLAFAQGRAEGELAGRAAATAEVEPVIQELTRTIDEVGALRAGILRRTERDIVKLALALAERIVHRELTHDRTLLLAMARVAIDQLGDQVAAKVYLHPADFEAVAACNEEAPPDGITLVPDPQLSRGGCRIESAFGTIDAGVDAQIRELTRSLLGEDHEAHATPA